MDINHRLYTQTNNKEVKMAVLNQYGIHSKEGDEFWYFVGVVTIITFIIQILSHGSFL